MRVRKTVKSDYIHVCPSAGNNSASSGRIFVSVFRKSVEKIQVSLTSNHGVPRGGVWGVRPPPEIPKALQNRAKLNPICENCLKLLNLGRQHTKMFGKKAVKF